MVKNNPFVRYKGSGRASEAMRRELSCSCCCLWGLRGFSPAANSLVGYAGFSDLRRTSIFTGKSAAGREVKGEKRGIGELWDCCV